MKKMGNEIKTGLMIVTCILILLFLTVKTSGIGTFKKGYNLKVRFDYAGGIKKGAPVQLTGVEIGEVKDVQIRYVNGETHVIMTLWLDKSARVHEDSKAYVATMGLMGEKYLELTRGSKDSAVLKEGSLIVGKEPVVMEEMMDKATEMVDNLNAGIGDLRRLTKDVDLTLTENRSNIDGIIKNMSDTSRNFAEFSEDIKRHPWKLLIKTKEKKAKSKKEDKGKDR
jgi:phospholipid/cholesterol/gamma-HCH transport system substrate-binding protein